VKTSRSRTRTTAGKGVPDTADGVDALDPATTVRDVLGVPDLPVEILGSNRWTAAAQTAARYAHGPIFLVGDAAHRFPPAGATGVSTAMHDAHNLAWKLAAVLRGHAGQALLDSYAEEREPVGRRNTDETGTAWSRLFNTNGAPFAGRSLAQIDMGYQYRSSAVTIDGSPDADPPGADYEPTAAPGCRAPHLWVNTPHARPRSTYSTATSSCSPRTPAHPGGQPPRPPPARSAYPSKAM